MTTLFIKSLLTSLCQREDLYPSFEKRGRGRFSDLRPLLTSKRKSVYGKKRPMDKGNGCKGDDRAF
jgi:hypothetical protein